MKTIPILAWGASALLSAASVSAALVTGFEPPTYTSGAINGQDGWTSTNNANAARVLTAAEFSAEVAAASLTPPTQPVHGGTQALFVTGASITTNSNTVRTISGLTGETLVSLDLWAQPLTLGSSQGNIFLTMEDAAGNRAAAFRFGLVNSQPTIDYGSAVTGIWVPSGTAWSADTWYHLGMEVDYTAKTYDFFINGAQVNADPIPFYTATSANFSQIRIFRGASQSGMIVDDLRVVAGAIPEPGVMAVLFCSGVLGLRRRRQ